MGNEKKTPEIDASGCANGGQPFCHRHAPTQRQARESGRDVRCALCDLTDTLAPAPDGGPMTLHKKHSATLLNTTFMVSHKTAWLSSVH